MTKAEKSTEALWEFLSQDERNVSLIVDIAALYTADEEKYKLFKQSMDNIEKSFDLIKHGYRPDKCGPQCGIIKNVLNTPPKSLLEAGINFMQAIQDHIDYSKQ